MATRTRSEIIMPGDTARLVVTFREPDGTPVDLDSFPALSVIQPSGNVVFGPSSAGVYRLDVGKYGYDLDVELAGPIGVWTDIWQGTLSGSPVMGEFNFVILTTQTPAINSDGYLHLGDDPGFNYSQNAIANINGLLKMLEARLKNSGKRVTIDENGNKIFTDCDVFDLDQLVTFLAWALSSFNEIPHFTFFTFDDTEIIHHFGAILTDGAAIVALSSQALIERGREFQINDNGVGFTPPTMSELLNSQYGTVLQNWYDRVKLIKHNMKPAPTGLGVLSFVSGAAPQIRRLRMLRARQIF